MRQIGLSAWTFDRLGGKAGGVYNRASDTQFLRDFRQSTLMNQPRNEESIQLDQFLKLIGVVSTGGQAKILIQSGEVLLNDELETRRRKKLFPGDVVEVQGEQYVVATDEDVETDENLDSGEVDGGEVE